MRITRLQASNIMRLVAIDITPAGNLILVGGKNGAGKTSAINSVAMALGGAALCPTEPIHEGESEATIKTEFDTDLVVTRKFNRDKVHAHDCATRDTNLPDPIMCSCNPTWSETRSTLSVTNKAGAKYPSPQALLDRLVGRLAFDPLAFKDDKDQAKTLRDLVKLDVTPFEKERAIASDHRAMTKKTLSIKQAQLLAMPKHDGVSEVEVPLNTNKLREAEDYRKIAEEAGRWVDKARSNGEQIERQRNRLSVEIGVIQAQLKAKEDELARSTKDAENNDLELDARKITAEAARAVVPDVIAISSEMTAVEATNVKVRDNKRRAEADAEVRRLEAEFEAHQLAVDAADNKKIAALRDAKFPVDGLGLSDAGVTFNSLPFAQASSAEQLRVSVAIGLALNPTLKVLLIRNGNLLDEDSLAALAAQAEAAKAQVWVEWVTKDATQVQVMIEDGHVV